MRKNGVNRNLTKIEGGISAVDGFSAGACNCGICASSPDIAVVLADCRCDAAALYTPSEQSGASIEVSKKHLKDGLARAVFINGGIANVFLPHGEKLADAICDSVGKTFGIIKEDVLISSGGKIGGDLSFSNIEKGIKTLSSCVGTTAENIASVTAAVSSQDLQAEQIAYSFEIGDFPCKIGALYKGTGLVLLVTNVNISSKMLKSALLSQARDSLCQVDVGYVSTPNDAIFVLANGKAGNSRIDCTDTEYKKFVGAFGLVLTEISKAVARKRTGKLFCCEVVGAKSKQIARETAKGLVGIRSIMNSFSRGETDIESIVYFLTGRINEVCFEQIKIALRGQAEHLVLLEDGKKNLIAEKIIMNLLSSNEIYLEIDLGMGNYRSVAYASRD